MNATSIRHMQGTHKPWLELATHFQKSRVIKDIKHLEKVPFRAYTYTAVGYTRVVYYTQQTNEED